MADTDLTIPALLARRVEATPHETYVVTPSGRLTFAEADERSADAARWLLGIGVGKGARVGLFFPNGHEWVIWWLAVSRVGAVAVPLSTMYKPAEIATVTRLADVAVLIAPREVVGIDVAERFEAALPDIVGQTAGALSLRAAPYLRRIVIIDGTDRGWADGVDADRGVVPEILAALEAEVTPADLAIMIHTSGSTADPKGVLHTHGTVVRQTSTWPDAIRSMDPVGDASAEGDATENVPSVSPRILCAMPFFWVGGLLAAMGALHGPVTLLVMARLDAGTALELIERERASAVIGWPAFTAAMRAHPTFETRDLSSAPVLRDGPLDIAMIDTPDGFPRHRTMTETAGGFVATELAVVDSDGARVPTGTVGELLVRGTGLMAGYNKRERWETFDADGWYHSGDRVYRVDGDPRVFYVGRTTDLIKSAGANVSPLEVETVIEGFDDVGQCIVLGVADPERGETVCAVIVPADDDVDLGSVAARAREALSSYKVPRRWVVTDHDRIPTLPSGKLDRKTLHAMIVDGSVQSVTV